MAIDYAQSLVDLIGSNKRSQGYVLDNSRLRALAQQMEKENAQQYYAAAKPLQSPNYVIDAGSYKDALNTQQEANRLQMDTIQYALDQKAKSFERASNPPLVTFDSQGNIAAQEGLPTVAQNIDVTGGVVPLTQQNTSTPIKINYSQNGNSDNSMLSYDPKGEYGHLKLKNPESFVGNTHRGILSAASSIQNMLGDNLKYFSAFNDNYHQNKQYRSRNMHKEGLAMDFVLSNPTKDSIKAAHKNLISHFNGLGLKEGKDYRVMDEYNNPSRYSTGGHFDVRFLTSDAAEKYYQTMLNTKG